jgi:uncharacterized protein YkwD
MKKFIFSLVFSAIASVAFSQNIQLGKDGFTATQIELAGYEILLNETRENAGAGKLVRNSELDKYCYERCLRLAKIFMANPDDYQVNFESPNSTFHKEGHLGFTKTENAHNSFGSNPSVDKAALINNGYNHSPGHFKARVNPKWKNYGTCTIVISFVGINTDYDPSNPTSRKRMPQKITISYEAFE